ncbi:MAG: PadR family transcriptional regulator [Actinomycetota bacterium]|nr:PadR family transcriptional regulator [Actinomycetota bacterium]
MSPPAVDDVPAGLPRGFLEPCLLLLLAESPSHGYELLEQLRGLGLTRIDAAALYRSLRGMDQAGLVECWWEPSQSGPARRTYSLTEAGRERLGAWGSSLFEVHRRLGEFLTRFGERPAGDVIPR